MPSQKYESGTIIKGKMRHRAVVLYYMNEDEPVGVMITSSGPENYPDNEIMKSSHFETGHPFGWRGDDRPSYMVCRKFIKIREWGEFRKNGKLTPEGLEFVNFHVRDQNPMYWRDYVRE